MKRTLEWIRRAIVFAGASFWLVVYGMSKEPLFAVNAIFMLCLGIWFELWEER